MVEAGEDLNPMWKTLKTGEKVSRGENLVKIDVSTESLRKYHRQGWHFFIRTVDERKYITIRRKGKERSLGPYSDELWKIIEGLGDKGAREGQAGDLPNKQESPRGLEQARVLNESANRILKTFQELARFVKSNKHRRCVQVRVDGFCGRWILEKLPEQAKQLTQKETEYMFKKLSSADGKNIGWYLKPFDSICKNCPAYFDEQMIRFLNVRRLDPLERILS